MSGLASFAVFCRFSLLWVAVWKIFGSELLFLGVGLGLGFFGGVLLRFFLYVWAVCSRNCLDQIFLMRSCVSGLVLSLSLVFRRRRFCFSFVFKRERSGSHRTPPHALVLFVPVFFCPAALGLSPVLAVRPASWRFFGVPFWGPARF